MQDIAIVTSPAPAWVATIASPESGDSGGTATWQEQNESIAARLGHIKGTMIGSVSPAITGTATFENVSASGTLGVTGATTLGATDINGTTTLDGATTAANFTMSSTNKVKLASRSITRIQPYFFVTEAPTVWTANFWGEAEQLLDNSTDPASCPIRVPHGAVLTAVSVRVAAVGGHGGLPGTMPRIFVTRHNDTGAHTSLGNQIDTSASTGTYQTAHDITLSGLSETIDRTLYRYSARLTGEAGANFIAGLRAVYVSCTYTITAYDED